ncbi:MAG: hypothetical protein HY881_16340 [Deltaproteobacteria bacterium]|nr:hypothetical protein [Deltaproteobacteria bacterium]
MLNDNNQTCARPSGNANMSSPRTQARYQAHRAAPRWVSTTRAEMFTRSYRSNPTDPLVIRRAKAYAHTLEHLPIAIHHGELLVGGLTERPNGAILFPETNTSGMRPARRLDGLLKKTVSLGVSAIVKLASWIAPHAKSQLSLAWFLLDRSFDSFETRPVQPFQIDDPGRKALRRLIRYWKPRSAYQRFRNLLTPRQRRRQAQFAFTAESQFVGGMFLFNANLGTVVDQGIDALVGQIRQKMAQTTQSEETEFYQAVIISLTGVIRFAERYAALAERSAATAESIHEQEEMREIARICRKVPGQAAESFREAFQSAWFAYLALIFDDGGMEVPYGRLDQILGKFYETDRRSGFLTEAAVTELVEAFFVKASEIEFLLENGVSRVEDGNSGRMTVTIGGIDDQGSDATNGLSAIFLDVAGRAGTIQPNVAVRIHGDTAPDFLRQAMRVIASGANTIQLFNDAVVIDGFVRMGIPLADARDYIISGCVQPVPRGGYGSVCASHIVLPRTLELFLKENRLDFDSYADFLAAYQNFLSGIVADVTGSLRAADQAHLLLPNAFVSALVPGALTMGRDVKSGSGRHNLTGISQTGIGTLVDSLHSIETLVFREQKYGLRQMVAMTSRDFHGYEKERQYILNRVPKFGNDVAEVDVRANMLVHFLNTEIGRYTTFRGGRYVLGLHSEAGHVVFGMLTGATPDGRRQLEALSVGAGVAGGRDRNGYTAFLNSILAIDFDLVAGGSSVNIRVNPRLLENDGLISRFSSLVTSYFKRGGPHLQVNVVSTAVLRAAQARPADYADLIVRISGYSARFVELSRQTQDELISRSEQT